MKVINKSKKSGESMKRKKVSHSCLLKFVFINVVFLFCFIMLFFMELPNGHLK